MKTLAETTTTTAVVAENGDLERKERESRSLALEKAYVHDVYDQLSHHFSEERYRPWPRVRQFLEQLEPGSLVCDAGCGNGKYLQVNPSIFKVGSDRCAASVDVARRKDHEVLICDALNLPYRDESFDAALSIAVIHHLATRDRRVRALRELARILRVGGRILITVWAKEQRHRKFESQDILVPWRTPDRSSSEEKAEVGGNEHESIATTTTTSDEDVTHYHAYSQTSESDSCYSCSKVHHSRCPSDCSGCLAVAGTSTAADGELPPPRRRHHRPHHKGRSFDPHRPSCSSQSSSDLSSPSDSCYSFVRKALQKLASTRRAVGNGHHRRSWFTLGESIEHQHGAWSCAALEATDPSNELPIELRHLDSEEDGALLGSAAGMTQTNERISRSSPPSLGGKGDSSIFFGSEPPAVAEQNNAADSSSSISPILPRRSSSSSLAAGGVSSSSSTGTQPQPSQQSHGSRSLSLSDLLHSLPVSVSSWLRHRLSEEDASSSLISPGSELERPIDPYSPPPPSDQDQIRRSVRPMLTKQKRVVQIFESYCEEEDDPGLLVPVAPPDDRQSSLSLPKAQARVFKQGSMNDSLLSAERLKEREKLKQSLLPRQVTWSGAPTSSPLPESSPRPSPPPPLPPQPSVTPPAKQTPTNRPSPSPLPPPPAPPLEIGDALKDFTSFRNGFVRIWQTLRGDSSSSSSSSSSSKTHLLLDDRNCDKPWLLDSPTGNETPHPARSLPQRRPPSLLEKRIKSFCGWGIAEESATGSMSPSPRRLPPVAGSEEDFFNFSLPRCCADQDLTFSRSVHPHRLSCQREEGSDSSSKDSSLQSDTSVDSEDSCVSVIYVPRPGDHKGELEGNGLMVDPSVAKTRNNSSSSSDGSPKVKVFPTLLSFAAEMTDPAPVKSPGMTAAQQEGQQTTNSPQRQSCLRQPNALAASNETGSDEVLTRSLIPHFQQQQQQQQARPVHRLLSFEVFNPETDDMDSDSDCGDNSSTTSESSSSNSAGSVISVGDPMWPAFQDRRQTILSGSSLDFQTSASCDLVSSEQADNSLIKQDSNDSWPASIEDPSAQLTSSSHTSRHNQSSPVSLVATGIQESQESKSSPSPSLGESSTGGSSAKQQQQQEIHSDVEEWRVRSSLGPLDECHEEEGAELGDAFQYNKSLQQQQQQTQQSAGVQQQQQQWKLEKVKGSFSASTSSLDSSISAPSYSSARQSSSASAISTASEMRKSSDDSTGFMSTLPLLRSRVANCAAASSAAAGASASSTTGFHQIPSTAGSGGTGIRASGNKPINCGDDEFCSKPLNKMLLGGCGGDQRQRSADRDSSLSISTSQDSLPSDAGGSNMGSGGGGGNSGTVTLHRYYHVFRQGELDQLIERYVDSLHIISSYYDHANHCVVAEKVHVWTI